MDAVDTNIMIYAHDPRDTVKQSTALVLLQSLTSGALLWQVACEYLWVSRKLAAFGYDLAKARSDINHLRQVWTSILPSWNILDMAEQLQGSHSLSFWDALIIAACLEAGVTTLYSEDFDAYPMIGGLHIINPFKSP